MSRDATDSAARWRERVETELGETPFESLERTTPGGVELQPLYTASDRPLSVPTDLAEARSPRLCGLLETPDLLQAVGRARADLDGGAEGLFLRLDSTCRGGVGDRSGLALQHGADVERLLRDLELEGRDLWVEPGANALPWATLYLAARQGDDDFEGGEIDPEGTASGGPRVHFGGDPLAALAGDGALPRDLMKLSSEMAALVRFVGRRMPGSTALTLSTDVYQEAGADPALELGVMVATLWETLRLLAESGLEAADVAPRVSLRFAVGTRVFPEIAKLRAARLLWRATLGAAGVEGPPAVRLHAVGSRRPLSSKEASLNLLRATEQAFVASCGGADALSLPGFDRAARATSGDLARRLARNTGLILEHEGRLGRVADPAAGSYYAESLTRELAEAGWEIGQAIEAEGGLAHSLVSGALQERVAASAERRARAFSDGDAAITGVTHYVSDGEERLEATPPEAVRAIDGGPVDALDERRQAWSSARSSPADYSRDFVVDELVGAALQGETIAQLATRLGGAEGAPRCEPLPPRRDAGPFEVETG